MTTEPLTIIDKGSYLLVEFFGEFGVEAGKQCVDRIQLTVSRQFASYSCGSLYQKREQTSGGCVFQ